jgi:hypothetical protein
MANAGIMNKNNHGESVKKLCKLAVPMSRILKSFSKKNKNNAETNEKAAIIIHALQFPK